MEDYEVVTLIGEGSFARVFKARHRMTKELFALKLIPKVGKTQNDIAALRQEFKIHKGLDHPNIVKVHDAFETHNELIVVTEFVPNELHKLFDNYRVNTLEM